MVSLPGSLEPGVSADRGTLVSGSQGTASSSGKRDTTNTTTTTAGSGSGQPPVGRAPSPTSGQRAGAAGAVALALRRERSGRGDDLQRVVGELAAPILVNRRTFALGAAGSPHYLSPETVKGGRTTFVADYYALGVVAWRLATGKLPVDGRTTEQVLGNTRDRNIMWRRIPSNLPHELIDLICGLMEEDPLQRYGNGGALELLRHPFFLDLDLGTLFESRSPLTDADTCTLSPPAQTFVDNTAARGTISFARQRVAQAPIRSLDDMPKRIPGSGGAQPDASLFEQRARRPAPIQGEAWTDEAEPGFGAGNGTWSQYCAQLAEARRQ